MFDKIRLAQTSANVLNEERRRFLKGSMAMGALATGPLSLVTGGGAAAQAPNKTLEAMVPAPFGEQQRIGAEPRPAEDSMLRAFKGTHVQTIEGVEKPITFAQGARKSATSISWNCWTNQGNHLAYEGRPLLASYLAWYATNISWQAGVGWPVFETYCPAPDYDFRMKFRDAHRFQIVPVFGGYYWLGCGPSGSAAAGEVTEVVVWVNDFPNTYGDNAGTFEFVVTGWSDRLPCGTSICE
jgi:hypothetical protein